MIWLAALVMLLFEGLAVSALGGMVTNGIGTGLAMATAVLLVILGAVTARAMYRPVG